MTLLAASAAVPAHAAKGTVNALYAASLLNLNEKVVGPAFTKAMGYTYQGQAKGSLAIANLVKAGLQRPDVVELADPAVNGLLSGNANGNHVRWYLTFARSELVVGFTPKSSKAPLFRRAQRHRIPWYRPLLQPGLRFGRTDPNLDPKGYRTLFMAGLAERLFHLKHFSQRVLGSASNPEQVFPEEVLVARLLTGQVDAGVFYLYEARQLHIPYVRLPSAVNMGDPDKSHLYATQHFRTAQGTTIGGTPILFTITVLRDAPNPSGGTAFVSFVLSKKMVKAAASAGLLSTKLALHGDRGTVPKALLNLLKKR